MKRSLLAALVLLPCVTFAQAKVLKDKEPPVYPEIERGFFIGTAPGALVLFNAPGGSVRPLTSGFSTRIDIGGEFGERVIANIFLQASNQKAGSDYLGTNGQATAASGDFYMLTPGIAGRFNIVGFEDAQEVKRTWLFVRASGGVVFNFPKTLLQNIDVQVQAGPGVEYFTRLRHFSVGIEAMFTVLVLSQTFGVTITPTLRYSF